MRSLAANMCYYDTESSGFYTTVYKKKIKFLKLVASVVKDKTVFKLNRL